MAVTMYTASVPVFLQLLGGLKTTLTKGEEQCAAKKLDPAVVLSLRLYPDMFPLNRQVRQVCQHALGAATVAGVTAPTFPETDNSFAEMQSRIDKTIDCLKSLSPHQLDGREDTTVTIPMGGQPREFKAQNYLIHFATLNFYFHYTTAYNILRSIGIEIGKRDFMGQMPS